MIIAVVNQKGGVGKSTTAEALADGMRERGLRTLVIDLDAQGNLSYSYRAGKGATALGVLLGEVSADDAIQVTDRGEILPSTPALSGADMTLTDTGKEYRLKEALETVAKRYDHIVIDTPPALGILTVNALTASDKVVIPAQADIYSLHGIEQLEGTMRPIRRYCNPNLSVDGILLTRYNPRTMLSREVADIAEAVAVSLGAKLYQAKIREAVAVKEAQVKRRSLFDYAPTSNVAEDYRAFVGEVLA